MSELRCWFLRDVLDAIERDRGALALEQLPAKLPPRLKALASPARLRTSGPTETLSLDDGEELLLALDSALGDASGRLLETLSTDMFSRTLSFGGVRASSGDLYGTMARLQAAFERPFVGVQVLFELVSTNTGFVLTVGIPGRPRAARVLRHLAVGAIRAAQRHCHGESMELRLSAETLADRSLVTARYRALPELEVPEIILSAPVSRSPRSIQTGLEARPSRSMRSVTQPRLSEEVERILSSAPSRVPNPPPRESAPPRPGSRGPTAPPRDAISSSPPNDEEDEQIDESKPPSSDAG